MDIVKAILHERGMTVQELADRAGVKKRTLDPYIRGSAKWPNATAELLIKVADALEIDPHVILYGRAEIQIITE